MKVKLPPPGRSCARGEEEEEKVKEGEERSSSTILSCRPREEGSCDGPRYPVVSPPLFSPVIYLLPSSLPSSSLPTVRTRPPHTIEFSSQSHAIGRSLSGVQEREKGETTEKSFNSSLTHTVEHLHLVYLKEKDRKKKYNGNNCTWAPSVLPLQSTPL